MAMKSGFVTKLIPEQSLFDNGRVSQRFLTKQASALKLEALSISIISGSMPTMATSLAGAFYRFFYGDVRTLDGLHVGAHVIGLKTCLFIHQGRVYVAETKGGAGVDHVQGNLFRKALPHLCA